MRIAIYARVSTDKQETENQVHELREYCQRQGWSVVKEYVDIATGKHSDREEFKQMFEDARKRRFDLVLFWALDRLSREGTLATLKHIQALTDWGVGWKSYQEQHIDSAGPFKDVFISLMATFAKLERERLSERTKSGLKRAKREGKRLGRPPVFVSTARVKRLQSEGKSLREIVKETGWSLSSIMRSLRNERDTGA